MRELVPASGRPIPSGPSWHRAHRWGVALLLAAALSGCGTATDAGTAPPARTADPTSTSTQPSTDSPSTPLTASPTVSDLPTSHGHGLRGRLLLDQEVPALVPGAGWHVEETTSEEGTTLAGTCHRFALTSVGATRVVKRTFLPTAGPPATAGHVVAAFPDVKTAKRAYAVLTSWRTQCAESLPDTASLVVGPMQQIVLPDSIGADAAAEYFVLTYDSGGGMDGTGGLSGPVLDAEGVVRRGARIAVLTVRTGGSDPNAVTEPVVVAVQRSAALL